MRTKALTRLAFLGAAVFWLVLVFSDITVLFSDWKGLNPGVPRWLPRIMMDLYVISLFYYYKFKIERDESLNFTDLLWKVFATGLVVTVVSLSLRLLMGMIGNGKLLSNILFSDFVYQVNLALFVSFLLAAYTSWKRLILYQKSKWLLRLWVAFDITMFFVLMYDSISLLFSEAVFQVIIASLGVMVLILSANMKWVAYLNFKQKWTSLLLLALVFFYLGYFMFTVTDGSTKIEEQIKEAGLTISFASFGSHIFFLALSIFVITYSVFSFLVIVFNLPTSSVFEQKLEEVVNFQRISQSIQTEQSEESVYNILLESSVSSVFADAAWLEIKGSNEAPRIYTYRITEKEAKDIQEHLKKNNIKGILDQGSDKTKNLSRHLASFRGTRFRSLLAFPLLVKGENIGTLALLKELPDGFTKEMTRIVSSFSNQAGISIENFRLMEEAFQNERYKEELKIAKTVQKSLLPNRLELDPDFDISAFSESADEVGGDYYDTLRINAHQVALIIADVSGKGTTAAFHMSQMKGIFHSLAQQELDPKEFMIRANLALVYCLERGSFISATYFVVDTREKKIFYARAGHCPVLFYKASTNVAWYLKDKGTALGMIKSRDYSNFIETNEISYASGDMMVLYTDGITEAKNKKGEEFGNDLLRDVILEVKDQTPRQIQDHLISKLYEYSGTDEINDDYTTMIVKFT
ncbi:MAG: serine/threonine protein phosphatase [Azospira oryzae]|nr:MAG: serine/threonine protein phosphatase [Azospira oryzae]